MIITTVFRIYCYEEKIKNNKCMIQYIKYSENRKSSDSLVLLKGMCELHSALLINMYITYISTSLLKICINLITLCFILYLFNSIIRCLNKFFILMRKQLTSRPLYSSLCETRVQDPVYTLKRFTSICYIRLEIE